MTRLRMVALAILLVCNPGCWKAPSSYGIHERTASFNHADGNLPGIDSASITQVTLKAGPPQGVTFVVWSDLANGGGGRGGADPGGRGQKSASYDGYQQGAGGRRVEIHAETTDGVNGTISIDGGAFQFRLNDGPLLLVSTLRDEIRVRQYPFDPSTLPKRGAEATRQFARGNDTILQFFLGEMVCGKWMSADRSVNHEFRRDGTYRGQFRQIRTGPDAVLDESNQTEQGRYAFKVDGSAMLFSGDLFGQQGLDNAVFRIDSATEETLRLVRDSDGQPFELHFVPPAAEADVVASGHGGGSASDGPDGQHRIIIPFLQEGGRCVFVGMTEHREQPLAPSFVLGVRILDPDGVVTGGNVDAGVATHRWIRQFDAAGNRTVAVEHRLNDSTESLAIDGKKYDFAAGRIFVMDTTTEPVTIEQIRIDLAELVPVAIGERAVDSDALRITLHRLRHRSQVAAKWW